MDYYKWSGMDFALNTIVDVFNTDLNNITDIKPLKSGMTNRSFIFSVKNKEFIMRIPGAGTENLINRRQEWQVYQLIKDLQICDNIIYINPENGYKITEYIPNARVCNPFNKDDLKTCMLHLKSFHDMNIQVSHSFDLFEQIDYYENLATSSTPPIFISDYKDIKARIFSLKDYISSLDKKYCLTHIDAVHDNFIFDSAGKIYIIDWEYAGMQDPHVDIAMFCIYAMYEKRDIDKLIDIYFNGNCPYDTRIKIYCYIAICGLLWSNWCVYKSSLGISFGEYSARQYSYAKEYYEYVAKEIGL